MADEPPHYPYDITDLSIRKIELALSAGITDALGVEHYCSIDTIELVNDGQVTNADVKLHIRKVAISPSPFEDESQS